MGKGSGRRNEDINKVWSNWDTIFGKKDKETTETKEENDKKTAETDKSTKTK